MDCYKFFGLTPNSSEEEIKEKIQKYENNKEELNYSPFFGKTFYWILTHPELKEIHDEFLENEKEHFLITCIKFHISRFLFCLIEKLQKENKNLEPDSLDSKISGFIFENNANCKSFVQEKVLKIVKQIRKIWQEKGSTPKEFEENRKECMTLHLKKEFSRLYDLSLFTVKKFLNEENLIGLLLNNNIHVPDYVRSLSSEEIQRLFLNHLETVSFFAFNLEDDVDSFFSKTWIFELEIASSFGFGNYKKILIDFYNEIFSSSQEKEVINFLHRTDFLFSRQKSCPNSQTPLEQNLKNFQKIYQQEESLNNELIQNLNYKEWKPSSNLISLFSGEKIVSDYDALLGMQPSSINTYPFTQELKETKKHCQEAKEAIITWKNDSSKIVIWQGYFFPRHDAINLVSNAYFVFIFPELQDLYNRVKQNEIRKRSFLEVIKIFREVIETKDKSDMNGIQHDLISLGVKEIKEHLIARVLAFLKGINSFLERENNSQNLNFVKSISIKNNLEVLKEFLYNLFCRRAIKIEDKIRQCFSSESSPSIRDFCHSNEISTADLVKFFNLHTSWTSTLIKLKWKFKENEDIPIGAKWFLKLETFKTKVLSDPWNYLHKFGKKIEEMAKKEGKTMKEVISFFSLSVETFYENSEKFSKNKMDNLDYGNLGILYDVICQTPKNQTVEEKASSKQRKKSSTTTTTKNSLFDSIGYFFKGPSFWIIFIVFILTLFLVKFVLEMRKKRNQPNSRSNFKTVQ